MHVIRPGKLFLSFDSHGVTVYGLLNIFKQKMADFMKNIFFIRTKRKEQNEHKQHKTTMTKTRGQFPMLFSPAAE